MQPSDWVAVLGAVGSLMLAVPYFVEVVIRIRRRRILRKHENDPANVRRGMRVGLTEKALAASPWATIVGLVGALLLAAALFMSVDGSGL
ncbi:MAG: hypothetical protein RIB45_11675 [Marivibrio sp.]|uniref:hypothetical protein n=1 Tax=Marivibrio sp. TaxID=2039719 RepID=UPI0032EACE1F